jgi:hypothetical protein
MCKEVVSASAIAVRTINIANMATQTGEVVELLEKGLGCTIA